MIPEGTLDTDTRVAVIRGSKGVQRVCTGCKSWVEVQLETYTRALGIVWTARSMDYWIGVSARVAQDFEDIASRDFVMDYLRQRITGTI